MSRKKKAAAAAPPEVPVEPAVEPAGKPETEPAAGVEPAAVVAPEPAGEPIPEPTFSLKPEPAPAAAPEPKVEAQVGVMSVHVAAGPDGQLGTPDDQVQIRHNAGKRGPRVGAAPDLVELMGRQVSDAEYAAARKSAPRVIPSPERRDTGHKGGAPVVEEKPVTQRASRAGAPPPTSGRSIRAGAPRTLPPPPVMIESPRGHRMNTGIKARIGGEPIVKPRWRAGGGELFRVAQLLGVVAQRVVDPEIRAELQTIQGAARRLLDKLKED